MKQRRSHVTNVEVIAGLLTGGQSERTTGTKCGGRRGNEARWVLPGAVHVKEPGPDEPRFLALEELAEHEVGRSFAPGVEAFRIERVVLDARAGQIRVFDAGPHADHVAATRAERCLGEREAIGKRLDVLERRDVVRRSRVPS